MERLIVGYDDSPAARGALTWAVHHAHRSGAELIIVFVVASSFEWELNAAQINTDPIRKAFHRRLRGQWTEPVRACTRALRNTPRDRTTRRGSAQAARRNDAALIVIGMTRGELLANSCSAASATTCSTTPCGPW